MASPHSISPQATTGLILAGGQGRRMGGVNKGLLPFRGVPLAQHALQRLRRSADLAHIAINANQDLDRYATFGVPVWPDDLSGYPGPLAGLQIGLQRSCTPYLLCLPCDVPLFPLDLVSRLIEALQSSNSSIAIVGTPVPKAQEQAELQAQPVFCLLRTTLLPDLNHFIQAGGRKVGAWVASCQPALAPFNRPSDLPQAFANANTAAELRQLESLMA